MSREVSDQISVDEESDETLDTKTIQSNLPPEVIVKKLYSNIPPLIRAQSIQQKMETSNDSQINEIPMMRNLARRGSLDGLSSITVLENLHDKSRDRFV